MPNAQFSLSRTQALQLCAPQICPTLSGISLFLTPRTNKTSSPPNTIPFPSLRFKVDSFVQFTGDITRFVPFDKPGFLRVSQNIRLLQAKSIPVRYLRSPTPHVYPFRKRSFAPAPQLFPYSSPTLKSLSLYFSISSSSSQIFSVHNCSLSFPVQSIFAI